MAAQPLVSRYFGAPGTDSRILTASAAEASQLAELSRIIIEKARFHR